MRSENYFPSSGQHTLLYLDGGDTAELVPGPGEVGRMCCFVRSRTYELLQPAFDKLAPMYLQFMRAIRDMTWTEQDVTYSQNAIQTLRLAAAMRRISGQIPYILSLCICWLNAPKIRREVLVGKLKSPRRLVVALDPRPLHHANFHCNHALSIPRGFSMEGSRKRFTTRELAGWMQFSFDQVFVRFELPVHM